MYKPLPRRSAKFQCTKCNRWITWENVWFHRCGPDAKVVIVPSDQH